MTPLCEIGKCFGTDKYPWYTPFYHTLLRDRRMRGLTILEIGVLNGASLRMWQQYFPWADIYGMDINPKSMFEEGTIKTFLGDQGVTLDLQHVVEKINTPIDLVIDDGSHSPADQILGAQFFMPYLSEDGLYIIEDWNHPVNNVSDGLMPFSHSIIECRVKESDLIGRCIVIPKC